MVDFLVIGLKYSVFYSNVVSLFVEDKIQYGYNSVNKYEDGITAPGWWFSNIIDRRPDYFKFKRNYVEGDFKRFDERPDIINIDKKEDIPDNYYGLMGVPVSVLMHINRNQFELLGVAHCGVQRYDLFIPYIDGKFKFSRWIIRRRKNG